MHTKEHLKLWFNRTVSEIHGKMIQSPKPCNFGLTNVIQNTIYNWRVKFNFMITSFKRNPEKLYLIGQGIRIV